MGWINLNTDFFGNPAILGVGRDARDLYLEALCWCNRLSRGGVVPFGLVRRCGGERPEEAALQLVDAGLWAKHPDGYLVLASDLFRFGSNPEDGIERREAARLRESIIARDGLVCGICGGEVAADDVHVDHVVAIANGGRSTSDNLRVTHSRCNLAKGAR